MWTRRRALSSRPSTRLRRSPSPPGSPDAPSMRVLVVEDEPEVADLIRRALAEAAWAADVFSAGSAALAALSVNEYDVAVLDIGLPGIDGFEVCRRWRAQGGKTPILMLTARGAISSRVAGLDA